MGLKGWNQTVLQFTKIRGVDWCTFALGTGLRAKQLPNGVAPREASYDDQSVFPRHVKYIAAANHAAAHFLPDLIADECNHETRAL